MPDQSLATVAVFQWNGAIPPLLPSGHPARISRDDGEEMTCREAEPAALAIRAALKEAGHATAEEKLYESDFAWYFHALAGGQAYSLSVQWVILEDTNYIAVQMSQRRGCIATLFSPTPLGETLLPAKQMLSEALSKIPDVTCLRWISDDQFGAAYCRCEPFPPSDL